MAADPGDPRGHSWKQEEDMVHPFQDSTWRRIYTLGAGQTDGGHSPELATSTAVVFLSEGTQLGGCCTDMWLWSTYLKKPVGEKIFKVYVPLFVSTEALAWKGYVVSVCSSEQRFRCESVPCG